MSYSGKKNYDREEFLAAVLDSRSKRDLIIKLGLPTKGTYGYRIVNYFLDLFGADIGHFGGRELASQLAIRDSFPLQDIFDGKHPQYQASKLRVRLIKEGILDHKCEKCLLTEWLNQPIPLDLDHKNGKSWDHSRDNLRLLCRNCHAQTDTFCGKNRMK